ncbi:MAG: hypothetical protein ACFCUI_05430 [Bernardetiaceae bacterium]
MIVLVCLCWSGAWGQQLFSLFESLPDSAVMRLSKSQRQRIIQNFKSGKTDFDEDLFFRLHTVDHSNGFLGMDGAFEGVWQMCYWNLPEKPKKLVCVYGEGCGPVCDIIQFDFYIFDDQGIRPISLSEVVPQYAELEQRFFEQSPEEAYRLLEENDMVVSLRHFIPRRGKDILVRFGDQALSSGDYRDYMKGDKVKLIWEQGTFRVGEAFW